MKADDVLMGFVLIGGALTCFYLVGEYLSWQAVKASDLRARVDLREVYRKIHAATKKPFVRAVRRK